MRISVLGGRTSRLAKLALMPIAVTLLTACTDQANNNPTGDEGAPKLFGETANGFGFPHEVVTSEGIAAAGLYLPIFLIAVAIFVLIEGLLLFMAWRFRRKGTDGDLPAQTHGNNRLEFIWTAIPALIVTVLFIGSTIVLTDVEAQSDDPGVVMDVDAFRFGWTFKYMDAATYDSAADSYEEAGISLTFGPSSASTEDVPEVRPEAVLPINTPIRFRINALDVIHSFYVPAFFFKRDAIPGRTNEFEVTIEKPGVYGGQCAEFCGLNHSQMFFTIRAVEQPEYDEWVAEQTAGASVPAPEASPPDETPPDETVASSEAIILEIATTADKTIAFTTSDLEAPAGQATKLVYSNDAKVPHNVAIFDSPDASGNEIVQTETITGPGATTEATFTTPAEPGPYFFRCDIHPLQMTGTLTVTA